MRRMILVIAVTFLFMALYSFAGTDDQVDSLTAKQRAEVVARWGD